jgi:PAS domain S-box-containing protein
MENSYNDGRPAAAQPTATVNGPISTRLLPELYVRVLDSMTEGVSIADEDGIILYTNPAEDRMFGYGPGELLGQHVSVQNVYPPEDNMRLVAQVIEQLKASGAWTGKWRNKRKDGSEFQTFARITAVNLPEKQFFVCVQEDITARKKAEEELQQRTTELTDFFENATVGLHWVGPDGTILWANQAELDLLGYTRSEYIGRKIANFHVDRDVIVDILQRLQNKEELHSYEARLRCKDGSIRHVMISSNVYWKDGQFIHTRCFTRDITDRKIAEDALTRLAGIVESSDDAIISKDLNGIIRSWNKGAERMFGYTAEEIIGKPVATLAVPERVEEIPDILQRIRRGERVDHYETLRQTKGGRVLNISLTVSPIRNTTGEIIGASKIARDITDHKRKAELQGRLAAIVESSDDAIISKDLNGIIRSWNKGAERIFGYTAEEIIGKPVATLAVPERVEEIPDILQRIRRGERVDHYITKRQTKDGRVLTISLTVSPIRDASGTIIGASKVARDITDHEQAQDMLRAANKALRQANADLEQFAYAAAHDLQEPLRMVSIYCQMLDKKFGTTLGPDGQKYLNFSIQGAERMNALVQDLLAYIQASKFNDAVAVSTDSNVALEHAVVNLQVTIEETGATISRSTLPFVTMHEVHLEQLFQNLLGNAIKYRRDEMPHIVIGAEQSNDDALFFVRDNGIGIAPEYKEQIFELFKRLHTSDRCSGSGIGLATCKRIVEQYGGRIWVESELGRGSTFYFTVPK